MAKHLKTRRAHWTFSTELQLLLIVFVLASSSFEFTVVPWPGLVIHIERAGETRENTAVVLRSLEHMLVGRSFNMLYAWQGGAHQPLEQAQVRHLGIPNYELAMWQRDGDVRSTILRFEATAIPYALWLWARTWSDGFLPPATITGFWMNTRLPGGISRFAGTIGLPLPTSDNLTEIDSPGQNVTQDAAASFEASKSRRARRKITVEEAGPTNSKADGLQLWPRQKLNATRSEAPTDPWDHPLNYPKDLYKTRFSNFRGKYAPADDGKHMAIICIMKMALTFGGKNSLTANAPITQDGIFGCENKGQGPSLRMSAVVHPPAGLRTQRYVAYINVHAVSLAAYVFYEAFVKAGRRFVPSVDVGIQYLTFPSHPIMVNGTIVTR